MTVTQQIPVSDFEIFLSIAKCKVQTSIGVWLYYSDRPLNSHSFGVRLKLLGQISHSHSRPPKSHSFAIFSSPGLKLCINWLYSYRLNLHAHTATQFACTLHVHCESHRFHKQNLAATCMQHCLPNDVFLFTDGVFCSFKSHDKLLHFY